MSRRDDYIRHSRHITRGPRWRSLRQQALRRDGWACVKCGARKRLEIDHIEPVRKRPDLAWTLSNLQTLCARHHSEKTRIEVGHAPLNPKRQAWADLVRNMGRPPIEQKG